MLSVALCAACAPLGSGQLPPPPRTDATVAPALARPTVPSDAARAPAPTATPATTAPVFFTTTPAATAVDSKGRVFVAWLTELPRRAHSSKIQIFASEDFKLKK